MFLLHKELLTVLDVKTLSGLDHAATREVVDGTALLAGSLQILDSQNLFTLKSASFTGVDPENPNFGYPIPVNVTLGINVSF